MEPAVVASPGGRWERAFLLLVVPPRAVPLRPMGVGQPKPPSTRLRGPTSQAVWYCSITHPISPSLVRRLQGGSGMDFSQEGSSHKTTVKPEL